MISTLIRSRHRVFCIGAFVMVLASMGPAHSEARLSALFTDHMVLQRGRPAPVWGWADEGESVTVEFRGHKLKTKAKDGKWMVKLPSLKAGGPDVLTVTADNKLVIRDVLVGEVWICSGQSNMEWPMTRSFEPAQDIAGSANPNLRLFTVPKRKTVSPAMNVSSAWVESGPETVKGFSAVAYYFGRDLQKALGVPVGLIHTSWGGSPAEVWMKHELLAGNADYKATILDTYAAGYTKFVEDREKFLASKKAGTAGDARPPQPPFWGPSELYNGMIAPLIPYAIQGAIWYQGESNAGRAHQYRSLFADMIRNWRSDWGQGNFPFLFVQLAPWDKNRKRSIEEITKEPVESDWAELREAQSIVAATLPNTGMAVITDVGDKDDIHPSQKQPVGARLALAARRIAHGHGITHSGPVYSAMAVKNGRVELSFHHVGKGLEARGGELTGFAIAGEDRKFYWAKASILGSKVVVESPSVPKPVAVRFGWSEFPVVNLWNKDGLPASPFRTDDFPMVTQPKK